MIFYFTLLEERGRVFYGRTQSMINHVLLSETITRILSLSWNTRPGAANAVLISIGRVGFGISFDLNLRGEVLHDENKVIE